MFQPRLTDWPMRYTDYEPALQPRGGVAPLRYDLALARYVERQAAHRASTASKLDVLGPAIRLCAWIAHGGLAALRALRPFLSERPRDLAG